MPSNQYKRCHVRTAAVDVKHPLARSFILPSHGGAEARSALAERFELLPDRSLAPSNPCVATRREQLKVEVALRGEAEIDGVSCFMRDLPIGREAVFCGRCVLDGYAVSGPFAPEGFEMTDAAASAVQARREDFARRMDAAFGDAVPPERRRVFIVEWSLRGLCACPCNAEPEWCLAARLLDPKRPGGRYRTKRLHIGTADGSLKIHLQDAYRTESALANCPCLEARLAAGDLPGGRSFRGKPFHGVYLDVWPGMRPAASRAVAHLRAAGLLTADTVVALVPFDG